MTRKLPYTIERNNEPMNLDEKCFDYLIGIEQENQQLKVNCNIGNENLKFYKQQLDLYKSVIDKLDDYIKRFDIKYLHEVMEHNLVDVLENFKEILDKVKKV